MESMPQSLGLVTYVDQSCVFLESFCSFNQVSAKVC